MSLYITPSGRVYCPEIGRFLQKDPLAPPGANPYTYANDKPVMAVDPSGGQEVGLIGPVTFPLGFPDWFDGPGRYIFRLWCSGEGAKQETVVVTDWGDYMMSDDTLTALVASLISKDASKRTTNGEWSYKGPATLTPGNDYQTGKGMLHGANENVGGFQIHGHAQVADGPGNCRTITYFNKYDWYDLIKPNPQYFLDRALASFIKRLCNSADYKIRIHWEADCTVIVDEKGEVKGIKGWPYKRPDPFQPEPTKPGIECGAFCNLA